MQGDQARPRGMLHLMRGEIGDAAYLRVNTIPHERRTRVRRT